MCVGRHREAEKKYRTPRGSDMVSTDAVEVRVWFEE